MNHTEEYNDQELQDMKERCLYMITSFTTGKDCYAGWGDIYKIALVEINGVLDERKIKEIPVRPKRKFVKKGYIGISPSCKNPGLIAITNTDIFSERNMMCSGDNNQIVPIEFEVEE